MGTRDEYVSAMKSAFVSVGKRLTKAWAVSNLGPIVTNPIIEVILDHYADLFWNWAVNESEMGVFFFYIDTRIGQQSEAFEKAAEHYHKIKDTASAQEVLDAENVLWANFKQFAVLTA